MIWISLIKGSKAKFYDPECVVKFDYDKDTLYQLKGIGTGKYNKRTKTWHFPKKDIDKLLDIFPDAIVNRNIKQLFPNRDFDVIDFPTQLTFGWGTTAYKQPTIYKLSNKLSPLKVHAKPYGFQKEGIKFLVTNKNSILADDMGLGKTLQSLTASVLLKSNKTLIICPNSAKYNWAQEIERYLPDASYIIVEGTKKEREKILLTKQKINFFIINYDAIWNLLDTFKGLHFDLMILDEAHRIKNRKAKRTRAVKKLNTKHRILLTGTPLMNRVEEMWTLLKIIEPNKWPGYDSFVKEYCEKGGYQGREIIKYKNLDQLKNKLQDNMLRRRKDEVLKDLPEKIYQDYYLDLDPETLKIYRQAETQAFAEISKNEKITINGIFGKLTRLKQIAVAPEILGAKHESIKIQETRRIVEEVLDSGQKIIIYSQFKKVTEYLHTLFVDTYKLPVAYISGDVPADQRQLEVNKFQNQPDCQIFLGTTQSCKEALNLTAATYVLFMDKLWNPADNRQAEDRCYRIGQKNAINVISLIAKNTIEEKIEEKLKQKQDIFNDVIETDGGAIIKRQTPKDLIRSLFSFEE